MSQEKTENTGQEKNDSAITAAELGAYALATGVGGYSFYESINKQTYDLLKKSDLLGKEIKDYLANRSRGMNRSDVPNSLQNFHKQFSELEHTQFKSLGIDSIWKRIQCLHPDQKIEAAVHGATVGGIIAVALGGAWSFVENRKLAKQVNEQIAKSNAQEPQSQSI